MKDLFDSFSHEFGKKLKIERELKRYTLQDLEFHTGIDSSDINKIEQGRANITFKTFLKLAKALDKHPKDLLDFKFD